MYAVIVTILLWSTFSLYSTDENELSAYAKQRVVIAECAENMSDQNIILQLDNQKEQNCIIKTSFLEAFLQHNITLNTDGTITFPDFQDKNKRFTTSWQWSCDRIKKEVSIYPRPLKYKTTLYAPEKVHNFLSIDPDDDDAFYQKRVAFLQQTSMRMWYMVSRVHMHQFFLNTIRYVGVKGCLNPYTPDIDSDQYERERRAARVLYPHKLQDMIKEQPTISRKKIIDEFIVEKHRAACNRLLWYNLFTQSSSPRQLPHHILYMNNTDISILEYQSLQEIRDALIKQIQQIFVGKISRVYTRVEQKDMS